MQTPTVISICSTERLRVRDLECEIQARMGRRRADEDFCIIRIASYPEIESAFGPDSARAVIDELVERLENLDIEVFQLDTPFELGVMGYNTSDNADGMLVLLQQPVRLGLMELVCDVVVGACRLHLAPDAATAIRYARSAILDARESCNRFQRFAEASAAKLRAQLKFLQDLRAAIRTPGAIDVHYQPQFSLLNGEVRCAEALVRWCRNGSMVSPELLIQTAEANNLIAALGRAIMATAFRQVSTWQRAGLDLSVAINISARQMADPHFIHMVDDLAAEIGVSPDTVEFELTETAATAQDVAATTLSALQRRGFKVAIDDFGTGYSSLERLTSLRFDTIKIDRAFVAQAPTSDAHRVVCELAILLASTYGITVVAEGIETEAQAQVLRELGCRHAQGHYFSAALPGAELAQKVAYAIPIKRK